MRGSGMRHGGELGEASRRYGIPEAKLNEIVEKGQHWWERLLQDLRPYRIALQATLCELAHDGKLVYHGHLGHELLYGIGHVLKVLLTAPIEFRIEQVRSRQGLTDGAARQYIEEIDKARSRRLMAMFGADWRDPNRYDLVLNMSKISREGAKRVIVEAAKLEEYQPTPASERAFNDLALGSLVHATLFASRDIRGSTLEVRADPRLQPGQPAALVVRPEWVVLDPDGRILLIRARDLRNQPVWTLPKGALKPGNHPTLARGECRVEGRESMLLADLPGQLQQIREELLRSLSHAGS